MIEDLYHATLSILKRQLHAAGAAFAIEDGDLLLDGHRLGVSIGFEGFTRQGDQVIAPLDVQLHLDGDEGNLFRVGTLGVGSDAETAGQAAIEEWYVLAAMPVLEALGVSRLAKRRTSTEQRVGCWDLFAGQVGVRGCLPTDSDALSRLYLDLIHCIRSAAAGWESPRSFQLRSAYLMVTCAEGNCEVQAAIDGMIDPPLSESIRALGWPAADEAYLYKQLFVLRGGAQP